MHLKLITPERTILDQEVVSLTCATEQGQITILPNHTPIVATLTSGELIAKTTTDEKNSEPSFVHVAGGFLEVRPNNEIIILADGAEHFFEIDIARAEEAKKQAEEIMRNQTLANEEYATAAWVLTKSLSRINIARKHSHRRKAGITSEGVLHE